MGEWKRTSLVVGINPWPSSWGGQVCVPAGTVWFGTQVGFISHIVSLHSVDVHKKKKNLFEWTLNEAVG